MKTYKIDQKGKITGLWDDFLAELPVKNYDVTRASEINFNYYYQKWDVFLNIGPTSPRLIPRKFKKRQDAVDFEVKLLNGFLKRGLIS